MEQVIEDLFPIMAIEHDCILSRRGDISIVFKAKLPEIFTQSDANYEVFISLGGALSKVYRTEVSPEEYLAYTTEEREKVQVQSYAKKYGNIESGIKMYQLPVDLVLPPLS
ncbi:DUF3875 domain-containing protein [Niabella yanshanensis]|uniref:DUF3875 domain-containing protein n=1 Tax=Niabella yanshanensis TaxID=577386 RepID=UPI001B86FB85